MKLYLPILFTLLSFGAKAQGLFEEKFKHCDVADTCLYCGDKTAHYGKDMTKFFIWKIEHAGHGYNSRSGNAFFEILVDSTGHSCLISEHNRYLDYYFINDMHMWIDNDMPDWVPATRNGHPINSTVILNFEMRVNWLGVNLVSLEKTKQ